MKCTVKIKIDQVTCPGTLHLQDRNPVFVNVYLFGRIQRSQPVYPTFPMLFDCKFKFRRVFTNAKTPEQVLEILEDEEVLLELRQECKGTRVGNVIAEYTEVVRRFLFPAESIIPKRNQLQRDVLLTKTRFFNDGKGLNPQLAFKTKTVIEVQPSMANVNEFKSSLISKKLPYVAYQDTSYVPAINATSKFPKLKERNFSEPVMLSRSLPITRLEKNKKTKVNDTIKTNNGILDEHCVCECPELGHIDIEEWLISYENGLEKNSTKPFRTGKDRDNLIAKRHFEFDKINQSNKRLFKGLCRSCVVPSKACVLCNAYKTVYGKEQFLSHRLQRKNGSLSEKTCKSTEKDRITPRMIDTSHQTSHGNPEALFENVPAAMSTPFPRKDGRNTKVSPPDLHVISRIESPDENDRLSTKLDPKECLFDRISYRTSESFSSESQRIHDRIKELMKKNDSVLQYEMSSSGNESDDDFNNIDNNEDISRLSVEDAPKSTSSRRSLPSRSVVMPSNSSPYWRGEMEEFDSRWTRRDVFDSSLKAYYKRLYEETAGNARYR